MEGRWARSSCGCKHWEDHRKDIKERQREGGWRARREFMFLCVCFLGQHYTLHCKSYTPFFFCLSSSDTLETPVPRHLALLSLSPSLSHSSSLSLPLSAAFVFPPFLIYEWKTSIDVNSFMCQSESCLRPHLTCTHLHMHNQGPCINTLTCTLAQLTRS